MQLRLVRARRDDAAPVPPPGGGGRSERRRAGRRRLAGDDRLLRSDEASRNATEAAEAEQLTSQQFVALLALPLDTARGVRMRELARCCSSTPSYATTIVDVLEERDLPVDDLRTLRDLLERAAAPYPWPQ